MRGPKYAILRMMRGSSTRVALSAHMLKKKGIVM